MPKLAIYVSKKDMRKLDPWRNKINFSQVFMKALQREIQERTRVIQAPKGKVAAAADHYKAKLAENSQALIDFGFQLGSGSVLDCRLSPEAIRSLLAINNADDLTEGDVNTIRETVGEDAKTIDRYAAEHGIDERCNPTWHLAVYSGYVKGVASAWKDVCETMRSK